MTQEETTAEEIKTPFGSYYAILRMLTHHTKNAERNVRTACESMVKSVQQVRILNSVQFKLNGDSLLCPIHKNLWN